MAAMKKDFGAFELHEKIGSGGMASVYLGIQKSLDRRCVLKILYPHLAEDESLVQRFEREARAAAMLRHPNIVQIIDCGRHEDVAYIAMEFVEGLDLKQWLDQFGTPPLEVGMLILHDLFSGLEHAHQHRIVHRDIKPANVMFTPDGAVKIMDFGLARRGEDKTGVTMVGSVLGTPAYMSPEQATGAAVDERSDIFSAGVVAFELLGGRRPFLGDSYSSVLREVLTVEPPRLGDLNPLVPDAMVTLVQRMLQKEVSKRYPNTGLVRSDLEAVLEEMGLLRGRDLLREYARDPQGVGDRLRKKRLARHLDQGIYFENMGMVKIDDALREFQRVLYLEPDNKMAKDHLKRLEREREKLRAEQSATASGADATVVMPPEMLHSPVAAGTAAPAARSAPPPREAAARQAPAAARAPVVKAAPARSGGLAGPRNLLIAAAGLLVVLIVVLAVILMRQDRQAEGGAPASGSTRQTAPAGGASAPGGTEAKESQDAPPLGTGAAGGAGAATGPATLALATDPPGAKVSIDGAAAGSPAELSAGTHTVRVEKSGYRTQEKTVTVEPGERKDLTITLVPEAGVVGRLVVKVTPYATLSVNGKPAGRPNVATNELDLTPGLYTVRAVHPAYAPKTWSNVRVEPNTTKNLTFDFITGTVGTLTVGSGSIWSYVWINGKDTGKPTPAQFTDLAPGSYQVTVVRPGYTVEGGGREVVVKAGAVTSLEFKLRQAP